MKPFASYHYLILLLIAGLAATLSGCNSDTKAEPIIHYVTATAAPSGAMSEAQPLNQPATDDDSTSESSATEVARQSTPVITVSALPPFPTSTPSITPLHSPTPRPPTATPTPSPTATLTVAIPDNLPALDASQLGIQIHPFITGEEWDMMLTHARELGVDWIKVQLPWSEMEPRPGEYNELFQRYVQQMQHSGYQIGKRFKVLISVVNAPDWARPEGFDPNYHGPPADPQALANFLRNFLIATVPDDNTIDAIEIWNEPNLAREWNGMQMDGATYMRYFGAAYDAIRSVDPDVTIITAGLAPVGAGLPGAVSDRQFLQQMYDAGLGNYADVKIGIHPYGWANPPDAVCCTTERGWADNPVFFFQETMQDYIEIMQLNNHQTQLWITELGWGTYDAILPDGGDAVPPASAAFFDLVTPEQQAAYLIKALEMMQQPPYDTYVEQVFIWNLNFAMVSPDLIAQPNEQAGYGLLNAAGQPRLVYWYLKAAPKISPDEQAQ